MVVFLTTGCRTAKVRETKTPSSVLESESVETQERGRPSITASKQ